jgi:hypothetical protein
MNFDPIEQFLRHADRQPTGSNADALELAQRVWRKHRRRQNIRVVGCVVAFVCLCITVRFATMPSSSTQLASTAPTAPAVDDQLNELRSQIAAQEQLVQQMLMVEQRVQDGARWASVARSPSDDEVTERAASAMVFQADRLRNVAGASETARRAYGQVIEYFPHTASAELARKHASEIRIEG